MSDRKGYWITITTVGEDYYIMQERCMTAEQAIEYTTQTHAENGVNEEDIVFKYVAKGRIGENQLPAVVAERESYFASDDIDMETSR